MNREEKRITLLALTWPIFIETLLHMVMGNADTLMLSQYSDHSVAAVGVSNQIISVVIVMFGFVAGGTTVLVSQNLGAKQLYQANEIAVTSISLNFGLSLILSLGLFIFSKPIFQLMDLPNELIGEAEAYMHIVGGFIFVQALIMTISAVLRSYGFTKDTMFVTIGMNIFNIFGNYLVIFGPFGFPVLGIKGVAFATIFSRFLGFLTLVFLLIKRTEKTLPVISVIKYKATHVKKILSIGIPSAGEKISYNFSQTVMTYFVAQMGTTAITTKVYAQNISMFIFVSSIAIGQGTQILIGHMVGENKINEAYQQCLKSLKLGTLISVFTAVAVYFLGDYLFSIFTDNSTVIEEGVFLLFLTIILEPGRASNIIVINSLRASGDVQFPVFVGIISMWGIGVPFAWFFGLHLGLGLIGIWLAFIADEWLRGYLMFKRWKSMVWTSKSFVQRNLK